MCSFFAFSDGASYSTAAVSPTERNSAAAAGWQSVASTAMLKPRQTLRVMAA
jgi:hypothetical protein